MADFLTGMSDMSDQYVDMTNYHTVTNNQTNADRIRAMSTEELATWIWNVQLGLARTMDDILDWLQSPAGEVEDDA